MQKEEFEKMVELIPTLTNLIKPEEVPEVRKIHFFWAWEKKPYLPCDTTEIVHWNVSQCEFSDLKYSLKRIAARDLRNFRLVFLFDNAKTKGQNYRVPEEIIEAVKGEERKKYAPDYVEKLEKKAERMCRAFGYEPRNAG